MKAARSLHTAPHTLCRSLRVETLDLTSRPRSLRRSLPLQGSTQIKHRVVLNPPLCHTDVSGFSVLFPIFSSLRLTNRSVRRAHVCTFVGFNLIRCSTGPSSTQSLRAARFISTASPAEPRAIGRSVSNLCFPRPICLPLLPHPSRTLPPCPQLSPDAVVAPSRPEIIGDFMIAMPGVESTVASRTSTKCLCMIAHRHLPTHAIIDRLPEATPYSHRGTLFTATQCCYSLRVVVSETSDLLCKNVFHPAVSSSADRPALNNHIDRAPVKICDT